MILLKLGIFWTAFSEPIRRLAIDDDAEEGPEEP